MSELLIELFCEEIPAIMQKNAEEAYKEIFFKYLTNNTISFDKIETYIGPRRITIYMQGLPTQIPAKLLEIKGPKIGAPEVALDGFCRSNNITKDELIIRETNDQKYYVYINKIQAQNTKDILIKTLSEPISEYVWPKSMYWGDYKIKWVRPLQNILCIFDSQVLPFKYGHLQANNYTYGHRSMSPVKLEVTNFNDYRNKLNTNFVVIDRKERQDFIKNELEQIASKLGLLLKEDEALLEEVAGLAEYPNVLVGKIDKKFLSVPSEVLISSMRSHQKYFSLFDKNGNFAPYFLFVANIKSDEPEVVIKGNEKVLSARLSDALYFYNQDLKVKLASNIPKLEKVIFHTNLGNLKEKTDRLVKLCKYISPEQYKAATIAAAICKSDILSEVVGEFPSLQGTMGYHYAKAESLEEEVAVAIRDHYKPQGPSDTVPSGNAAILALADKIDSLCGLIIAGENPTGSKDPYALRRQALGIIRIILTNNLSLNLIELVEYASTLFQNKITLTNEHKSQILMFLEERLKYYFKNFYEAALINAVLDFKLEPNLQLIDLKLKALKDFLNSTEGDNLLIAYKRASNIIGEQKLLGQINVANFVSKHENSLFNFITDNSSKIELMLAKKDYIGSLKLLAEMKLPISNFFDNVMVKDSNPVIANNRLLLLDKTRHIFDKIAKFDYL